jgi:hypothetical protein
MDVIVGEIKTRKIVGSVRMRRAACDYQDTIALNASRKIAFETWFREYKDIVGSRKNNGALQKRNEWMVARCVGAASSGRVLVLAGDSSLRCSANYCSSAFSEPAAWCMLQGSKRHLPALFTWYTHDSAGKATACHATALLIAAGLWTTVLLLVVS